MRISGPLYEGDSILRHGPAVSGAGVAATPEAEDLLQRNEFHFDRLELEKRARQLRTEYIGAFFRRVADAIDNWFERARQRERDVYLSQAMDHADLERRMRHLERAGFAG